MLWHVDICCLGYLLCVSLLSFAQGCIVMLCFAWKMVLGVYWRDLVAAGLFGAPVTSMQLLQYGAGALGLGCPYLMAFLFLPVLYFLSIFSYYIIYTFSFGLRRRLVMCYGALFGNCVCSRYCLWASYLAGPDWHCLTDMFFRDASLICCNLGNVNVWKKKKKKKHYRLY